MRASWYTDTMVPAPERGRAHVRSRRRRLRDRRGLAGLTDGARAGAARLVGRGAGGAPRRLERVGPQYRLRAAGLCASRWTRSSAASGSITPRRCGRCRRPGSNMCAATIAETAHAGRRPGRRLAQGLQDRQRRRRSGRLRTPDRSGPRRRGRRLADRARARGAARASTISTPCIFRAPSTSIRSIMRSGWRPRRKRPARASSRTRRRCRSIPTGVRKRITTPSGARARRPCRAGRQRASRRG